MLKRQEENKRRKNGKDLEKKRTGNKTKNMVDRPDVLDLRAGNGPCQKGHANKSKSNYVGGGVLSSIDSARSGQGVLPKSSKSPGRGLRKRGPQRGELAEDMLITSGPCKEK